MPLRVRADVRWLVELREGRDDYAVVARCGSRLVDAICTPSSTVLGLELNFYGLFLQSCRAVCIFHSPQWLLCWELKLVLAFGLQVQTMCLLRRHATRKLPRSWLCIVWVSED